MRRQNNRPRRVIEGARDECVGYWVAGRVADHDLVAQVDIVCEVPGQALEAAVLAVVDVNLVHCVLLAHVDHEPWRGLAGVRKVGRMRNAAAGLCGVVVYGVGGTVGAGAIDVAVHCGGDARMRRAAALDRLDRHQAREPVGGATRLRDAERRGPLHGDGRPVLAIVWNAIVE